MSEFTPPPLAALFPEATEADWRAAVEKVLKGADFDRKLVHRSADGIALQPLYPRRAGAEPVAGAAAGARWGLVQRIDHPVLDAAHRQALADLEGGATALNLVLAGSPTARGFGIAVKDASHLDALLEGVMLDLIVLRLETAPFQGRQAAELLLALAERRKTTPTALAIDLGLDPIGDMSRAGRTPIPFAELQKRFAGTAKMMLEAGFRGHFVRVDVRAVHEAGGSEAQELGVALATAVAYLRILEAEGVALEDAARITAFTLAVDADQFMSIARLRALRKLMGRVHEACGLAAKPIHITAETAWRMQTKRDAAVNMLRDAIAVFSAGVGGADAIAVLPHSIAQGLPDAFARRVARNMQHVLMEESNLWRVVDPAAGAGGIEALTDELCARGWAFFQEIEAAGGIVAALEKGLVQGRIAEARIARDKGLATRRMPITGTSEFPNLAEKGADVVDGIAPQPPARPADPAFPPLVPHRLAEPYEALRDRSDALFAETGARPRVFLANLGRIADFNARATFARNFFEAGGIEAATNDGFAEGEGTNLVALTDAFKTSGAAIACLCSSDAVYAAEAVDAAMALIASGAARVYLAGKPAELEGALAAAGVGHFIFVGCDVLKTLTEALDVARS